MAAATSSCDLPEYEKPPVFPQARELPEASPAKFHLQPNTNQIPLLSFTDTCRSAETKHMAPLRGFDWDVQAEHLTHLLLAHSQRQLMQASLSRPNTVGINPARTLPRSSN